MNKNKIHLLSTLLFWSVLDWIARQPGLPCMLLSEHGKGNNSVITNKILWNLLLHQITGPLYAEKIKGLTWCFPKFWNTPLYRFEIPIVKIKYNVWYYRPISRRESMLEIEELYTSRKYSFQVLLYWYLNWIFWITVFFPKTNKSVFSISGDFDRHERFPPLDFLFWFTNAISYIRDIFNTFERLTWLY